MAKYIKREAILEAMGEMYDFADPRFKRGRDIRQAMIVSRRIIENQPTADVQEVRHGKWIPIKDRFFSSTDGSGGNVVKCSVCGEPSSCKLSTPYCSICGAKMDEEGE